jgi:hypothetical protein
MGCNAVSFDESLPPASAAFLPFFDLEEAADIFLRNLGLSNYMAL